MTSDMAFGLGALAGFLALCVAFAWDDVHCPCCSKKGGTRK